MRCDAVMEPVVDLNKGRFVNTRLPETHSESNEIGAKDDGASAANASAARAPLRRLTIVITPRFMWLAVGALLVTLVLVLLVTQALGALVLIFFSIILAEAIRPLVTRLQRRHIPQPLAVILIYLGIVAILGGLLWVLVNPGASEENTLATQLPTYVARIQSWLAELEHSLSQNTAATNLIRQARTALATWLQQLIPALINIPVAVIAGLFGFFIDTVIVLTMSLFWLGSSARFKSFVLGLFPPDKRQMVSAVTSGMSRSLGGWVLGTLIAMLLIGSLTALGLLVVGAPYALLLGILAGFTELIPYLGPWISGTVAAVVTLTTTGDPLTVVWVILVFFIIQEVEGNVIEPLVMNKAVKLDPWLVLVAILIGGDLLGLVGVILAVPIAAVLQVITLEVIAPAIRVATHPQDVAAQGSEQVDTTRTFRATG